LSPRHFGGFTFDNQRKLAAQAIRNLRRILGDAGSPDPSREKPIQSIQVTLQASDSKEQIYHSIWITCSRHKINNQMLLE
jgi:hypothetical protein